MYLKCYVKIVQPIAQVIDVPTFLSSIPAKNIIIPMIYDKTINHNIWNVHSLCYFYMKHAKYIAISHYHYYCSH